MDDLLKNNTELQIGGARKKKMIKPKEKEILTNI